MYKTTIAAMALCALPVYAGTDGTAAQCAAITDSAARLECFDALASSASAKKVSEAASPGAWMMNVRQSPIDDSKALTIRLASKTDTGNGYLRRTPYLVVKCDKNITDVAIIWNEYIPGERVDVASRIGTEKAVTEAWISSTNNKATFEPRRGPGFAKEMMQSNTFAAQLRPDYGEKATAVFDTTGLKEAIKPIRAACGW